MNLTPLKSALLAALYIVGLVTMIYFAPTLFGPDDTIFAPMLMLSLFVLSAAIMGYLFLTRPLELFFEGKKQEAASHFLRTVAIFACIPVLFFLCMVIIRINNI